MSLEEHHTLLLSLQSGAQKRSVQNVNNTVITSKQYEIGCELVLISNRKSHTGCQLILTELFSPTLIALQASYVIMVEDRPIMSAKYCLPVPVFNFWPKLTHPAVWSLCDS